MITEFFSKNPNIHYIILLLICVIIGIFTPRLYVTNRNKLPKRSISLQPQKIDELMIREVKQNDLSGLLSLYTQLHNNPLPAMCQELSDTWDTILSDRNHYIIVGLVNNVIICSCVIVIIPNLTNNQRPYALIENVITDENYRNKGYSSALLDYAKQIAAKQNCYKIMLMTSSKKESTLNFYKKAGYNCVDKTGFIQWL